MDLQEFIHSLSQGKLRGLIVAFACLVILVVFSIYYSNTQFRGFSSASAMDSAQIAREILRGNGMKTKVLQPLNIAEQEKHNPEKKLDLLSIYDTQTPPVYPYYLATLFKITGTKMDFSEEELKETLFRYKPENTVLVASLVLLILTILIVYGWASRMFDQRVALLSTAIVALCNGVWSFSITGGPFPLLLFTMALAGWAITEAILANDEGRNITSLITYFTAIICVGIASLISYHFLWVALVFVALGFFLYPLPTRLIAGFLAVGILLLMWIPWFSRNIALVGHPFGTSWSYIFHGYGALVGDSIWRLMEIPDQDVGVRRFIRILMYGIPLQVGYLIMLIGSLPVIALFSASVLHPFKSSRIQIERWFWVICIVLLFFVNALTFRQYDPSSWSYLSTLMVMLPVMSIFTSAFFFVLLDRLSLPYEILRYTVIGLFCVIHTLPLMWTITSNAKQLVEFPPYFPNRVAILQKIVKDKELISSDLPWACAWYADRSALWLPVHVSEFMKIHDSKQAVVGILFTPKSREGKMFSSVEKGEYKEWYPILTRQNSLKLPFTVMLPLMPEFEYFYISDQKRW